MVEPSQTAKEHAVRLTFTDELLCVPFLDTDSPRQLAEANAELERRGYPRWSVNVLRVLIAPGLWHQALVWEEWSLGLPDILWGYGILSFAAGLALLVLACLLVPQVIPAAITVVIAGLSLFSLGVVVAVYRRRKHV